MGVKTIEISWADGMRGAITRPPTRRDQNRYFTGVGDVSEPYAGVAYTEEASIQRHLALDRTFADSDGCKYAAVRRQQPMDLCLQA
jgi:hypothetical protein